MPPSLMQGFNLLRLSYHLSSRTDLPSPLDEAFLGADADSSLVVLFDDIMTSYGEGFDAAAAAGAAFVVVSPAGILAGRVPPPF